MRSLIAAARRYAALARTIALALAAVMGAEGDGLYPLPGQTAPRSLARYL